MKAQMIRVISSPSSSTTGVATLIFAMSLRSLNARGGPPTSGGATISWARSRASLRACGLSALGPRLHLRLRRRFEYRDQLFRARHDLDRVPHPDRDEARGNGVIDEHQQRSPIARYVHDHDGLVVEAELFPGHALESLVERAEAARQDREGVRPLEHALLPLVHGAHDDELAHPRMRDLAAVQEVRNDSDDMAAGGECRVRRQAHEPDVAATIDQLHSGFREQAPGAPRRLA